MASVPGHSGLDPALIQNLYSQKLYDPVTRELMDDAVVFIPCGHTVSEKTAKLLIEKGGFCPFGESHKVGLHIPNLVVRKLAATHLALKPVPKDLGMEAGTQEWDMPPMLKDAIEKFVRGKLEVLDPAGEEKQRIRDSLAAPRLGALKTEDMKKCFGNENIRSFHEITQILHWPCPGWPGKGSLLALIDVIGLCPNLDTISLAWCSDLENVELHNIARLFPNTETNLGWKMSQLQHLDLSNCLRINYEGLLSIGPNCPDLLGLDLNGCAGVDDNGILVLTSDISGQRYCQNLNTLSLRATNITDKAFEYMTGTLYGMAFPGLQHLDLSYCKSITPDGVISFARAYGARLNTLGLQGCDQLDEATRATIAELCPNLKAEDLKDVLKSSISAKASEAMLPLDDKRPYAVPSSAFGKERWLNMLNVRDVKYEPRLPDNIMETINGQCEFEPNIRRCDAYHLLLIPETADSTNIHLHSMEDFAKSIRVPKASRYRNKSRISADVERKFNFASYDRSRWIFVRTNFPLDLKDFLFKSNANCLKVKMPV